MTAPLRDKRPAKDDPTIAERLRVHRTLSVAPQAELDWLIERGTLGYYLPGDEVVIKGEPVNTLYIILKGRVAYLAESAAPGARSWTGATATPQACTRTLGLRDRPGYAAVEEPTEMMCVDREHVEPDAGDVSRS